MKNIVAIVDYEMGNLHSVFQAVRVAAQGSECEVVITQNPDVVKRAERVILPGQGAMPDCMAHLKSSGLLESVLEAAHQKPLFGVCVGMQMLLDQSAESYASNSTKTLGLIPGRVEKFDFSTRQEISTNVFGRLKVPQIGWNQVTQISQNGRVHPIWRGVSDRSYFYFVHSFYAQPTYFAHIAGETNYGDIFASAVARDNIFATQFHPEKSSLQGLALYRNFLHWNP